MLFQTGWTLSDMYPWFEKTFNALMHQYRSNKLHHAVLMRATQGVGAENFSTHLAQSMLCQDKESLQYCGTCKACNLFGNQVHPDFHELVSEKQTIGVDLVRDVIEKIQKTAQLGGSKIVVINNIDKMTEAASNAFLKTLEEPTPDTFILLTTSNPERLLATITSRCEQVTLTSPSYDQSIRYLADLGISAPTKQILSVFSNSPISYAESIGKTTKNYDDFVQDLGLFIDSKVEVDRFLDNYADNELLLLDWLYHTVNTMVMDTFSGQNSEAGRDPKTSSIAISEWTMKTLNPAKRKAMHQGINKRLLLKELFQDFRQRCGTFPTLPRISKQ